MNPGICIFAKHPGCNKEYLFSVPSYCPDPHKGDILLVSTSRGPQIAIATSAIIESPDIDDVARCFPGAYLPLKPVLQVAGEKLVGYIRDQAKKEVYEELIAAFKKIPAVNPSVHPFEEDMPF